MVIKGTAMSSGRRSANAEPSGTARQRKHAHAKIINMAELGSGCYLTFSPASQGTLFINWSETPVDGALAFFRPNKTVPKFKFTTNGGRSELIRTIQGPQIKRYFQGWTQFVKLAREFKGDFVLLRGSDFQECPVQIVFNFKNRVTRAAETVEYKMEEVSAVAALHPANDCYGVITMEVNKFREVGEGLGAAMQF